MSIEVADDRVIFLQMRSNDSLGARVGRERFVTTVKLTEIERRQLGKNDLWAVNGRSEVSDLSAIDDQHPLLVTLTGAKLGGLCWTFDRAKLTAWYATSVDYEVTSMVTIADLLGKLPGVLPLDWPEQTDQIGPHAIPCLTSWESRTDPTGDRVEFPSPIPNILEPDDGAASGWSHKDFARAIGDAMGRRIAPIALPRPLMAAGAQLDRLIRGARAKLTPDRVAYFCHEDWVSDPGKRPPSQLWQPQVPTAEGLAATAAWYRAQGLV